MDQAEPSAAAASEPGKPTIVVKIGTSSLLSADGATLALSTIASIVEVLADLRQRGHGVVLVSSGAVGVGCQRLGLKTRPTGLAKLQALAAIGMPRLMHHYETLFSTLNQPIAQVLLSADALDSASGYANAQQTFTELIGLGVIPVVNENDSVSISELRFGDNDTLSALVALMVGAEHLFLGTDVDALYTSNPTASPAPGAPPAAPIREVVDIAAAIHEVRGLRSPSARSSLSLRRGPLWAAARFPENTPWRALLGGGGQGHQLGLAVGDRRHRHQAARGAARRRRGRHHGDPLGQACAGHRRGCGRREGRGHALHPVTGAARSRFTHDLGEFYIGRRALFLQHSVRSHKRWIMALPAKGAFHVRGGHSFIPAARALAPHGPLGDLGGLGDLSAISRRSLGDLSAVSRRSQRSRRLWV
jgi:uridylate kinase